MHPPDNPASPSDLPRTGSTDFAAETIAFLALAALKGIGYWTLWNLTATQQSLADLLRTATVDELTETLHAAKAKLGESAVPDLDQRASLWKEAINQARFLRRAGVRLLFRDDPAFPPQLRKISSPPRWLFVQGAVEALSAPGIAVVGTRKPSEDGRFLTKYVTAAVARTGATVISGLASGVDQDAHVHALRFGAPTVAYLGCGISMRLSSHAERLRREILDAGGAVVSEYLPSQSHAAENYVRRNRLQAGSSMAVVPVEWAPTGGTSHTVKYAGAFGRPLIGLRMHDWLDHPEFDIIRRFGGAVYTVPGEEKALLHHLGTALQGELGSPQLSLF